MAGGSRSSGRNFYPRPPRGGRRGEPWHGQRRPAISIHALREEGDRGLAGACSKSQISIHALREEGDDRSHQTAAVPVAISIHALREEGDPFELTTWPMGRTFLSTPSARRATRTGKPRPTAPQLFLSTPSARRATGARFSISTSSVNFYPRPPRGGRRRRWRSRKHQSRFLSTPSARRATKLGRAMLRSSRRFLSTPSARRATEEQ